MRRSGKHSKWIMVLDIVLVICLAAAGVLYTKAEKRKKESLEAVYRENVQRGKERKEEGSISLYATARGEQRAGELGEVIISPAEFEKNARRASFYTNNRASAYYRIRKEAKLEPEDPLYFHFEAYAETKCTEISVNIYDERDSLIRTIVCYVNVQPTEYDLALTGLTGGEQIRFNVESDYEKIHIGNVTLTNVNGVSTADELKKGIYNLSGDWEPHSIGWENGIGTGPAVDVVTDNSYLYTGVNNGLSISDISDPANPKIISVLENLGNVRRLALCHEGKALAAASRENGVFIIDIQDPQNPRVLSRIDTLELASGLFASGPYLFIASRYYGIEIYDIGSPETPVFCSAVKSDEVSERIDCTVYKNYLYAGVWGTQRVEIFDVSDVNAPVYAGYFPVDGNAYGLCTDGSSLFVSTGFHSVRNDYSTVNSEGYGTGNGVSIYDLTDPLEPEWQSTIRADGRYYYIGLDYWNVKVSHGIAYFSSLFNGLNVFDVSDPKAPVKIDQVTIPIPRGTELYQVYEESESVFPYDKEAMTVSPVSGVAVGDGYLYLAGNKTDTHVYAAHYARYAEPDYASGLTESGAYCYENSTIAAQGYESRVIKNPRQTYAAVTDGQYVYTAGSDGIRMYGSQMDLLAFCPTGSAVRDIRMNGGYLYTAEGADGMGIYEIRDREIVRLSSYKPKDSVENACLQIGISPKGNFAVLHTRLTLLVVLDVSDPAQPVLREYINTGAMYYRNICSGYYNQTALLVSHAGGISVFDFSEEDQGSYEYHLCEDASYYFSRGSFAMLEDGRILAVCENGYRILEPSEDFTRIEASELVRLPDRIFLRGYPVIEGNRLVVTDAASGQVTVADISDVLRPKVLENFYIDGNPDAVCLDRGRIYIPARYEGLILLTPKNRN